MRNLIAIPLLGLAVIVQSAIVGQLTLLHGVADVLLVMLAAWALQKRVSTAFQWAFLAALMSSLVSRLPWFIYLPAYGGTVALGLLLQRRVWQVPMLAMFSVTFLGTVLLHGMSLAYLELQGATPSLTDSLGLITVPSLLLNLLIAIPVFGMMRDVAHWVFGAAEAP
jgi:hypothetical protein